MDENTVIVQETPTPCQQPPLKPDSHLALAIVSLLFCWPFGIPSVVFATRVDNLWYIKDYAGANEAARKAKMWGWIGIGSFIVLFFLYIILIIVLVALGVWPE